MLKNKKTFIFAVTILSALFLVLIGLYSVSQHRPAPKKVAEVSPQPQKIKIITPSVLFSTAVYLNRNKTFISLPYTLGSPRQTIWLDLAVPANTPPITRLVYHPVLADLTWKYVEDSGLRLYQKNNSYRSLTEFIQKPPLTSTILADPHLLKQPPYNHLKATALPDSAQDINLDQVDYILTTYTDSRQTPQFSYYETTLDASSGSVNDQNQLNWNLYIPDASQENPLYLGDIHVDYRQY